MQSTLLLTTALLFVGPQAGGDQAFSATITVEGCPVTVIHEVEVPSRLAGVLASVEVQEGDEVQEGQEVARLDDRRAKKALEISAAKAKNDVNVRYAIKAAEVAEAEYRGGIHANRIVAGTIPDIEIQRLELSAQRGTLQTEQAQRDFVLEGLQRDLDQITLDEHGIKSPIDGIVVDVAKRRGEAVTAGELVFKVRNIDELRVEAVLKETEVPHSQLRKGQVVEFRCDLVNAAAAGDPLAFRGKITYIEPGIDQVSTYYRIYAVVNNNDARELLPGMKGTLTILPTTDAVAQTELSQ